MSLSKNYKPKSWSPKPSWIQLKRVAYDTMDALKTTLTTMPKKIEDRRAATMTDNSFLNYPEEIMVNIFVDIVSLDCGTIGKLPVVCKDWQLLIKRHKNNILQVAICNRFLIDKETYERFLNGRLIYNSKIRGKVELLIADLVNPLGGTFDLSQCGHAGDYLSISTGYRKEKKSENRFKVEIWLIPRFLMERDINEGASHLNNIFPSDWPETAPVGIIWTCGDWDNMGWYDYVTNQTMDAISAKNFYEKWRKTSCSVISLYGECVIEYCSKFSCTFSELELVKK